MNDYERLAEELRTIIDNVESLDAPDDDLNGEIGVIVGRLEALKQTAEARS